MLFDPNSGAATRQAKLIGFIGGAIYLAVVIGFIFIVVHFVAKFW